MATRLDKTLKRELEVEGEMRGDAALSRDVLEREFPDSDLHNEANVLVMPNVDAANISFNLLRTAAGNGIAVGGILLGAARPVHSAPMFGTINADAKLRRSATSIASSITGCAFSAFSIACGAIFLPPEVTSNSFLRSVIFR